VIYFIILAWIIFSIVCGLAEVYLSTRGAMIVALLVGCAIGAFGVIVYQRYYE
jgi:hypothetical protein